MQLKAILTDRATSSVSHFQEGFLDPTDYSGYAIPLTLLSQLLLHYAFIVFSYRAPFELPTVCKSQLIHSRGDCGTGYQQAGPHDPQSLLQLGNLLPRFHSHKCPFSMYKSLFTYIMTQVASLSFNMGEIQKCDLQNCSHSVWDVGNFPTKFPLCR